MKKVLIAALMVGFTPLLYAQERTLDERCDGHAKYVVELLKNRYSGESLSEQLELVEEWDDPIYREEVKGILREIIYKQPIFYLDREIALQGLESYIAAYRSCVKQYAIY